MNNIQPMIPPRRPRTMRQEIELMRRKLWIDTFLALANHESAGSEEAEAWADRAVDAFDQTFQEDDDE